jgi:hypothetical protein
VVSAVDLLWLFVFQLVLIVIKFWVAEDLNKKKKNAVAKYRSCDVSEFMMALS